MTLVLVWLFLSTERSTFQYYSQFHSQSGCHPNNNANEQPLELLAIRPRSASETKKTAPSGQDDESGYLVHVINSKRQVQRKRDLNESFSCLQGYVPSHCSQPFIPNTITATFTKGHNRECCAHHSSHNYANTIKTPVLLGNRCN